MNRFETYSRCRTWLAALQLSALAVGLVSTPGAVAAQDTDDLADEPGSNCYTSAPIDEDDSGTPVKASHDRFLHWAIAAHRAAATSPLFVVSLDSERALPPDAGSRAGSGIAAARPHAAGFASRSAPSE